MRLLAEENTLYLNFTSRDKYEMIQQDIIKSADTDDKKKINKAHKYQHTLFIINDTGLPTNTAGSLEAYLGNQIIKDIINLNQLKTITVSEDVDTGFLTVYKKSDGSIDTQIGDKNKLYIYCEYRALVALTFFNIYYYDENNQIYIPITKNGITTGIFNFINNKSDIDDKNLWTKKTFVYYPQDSVNEGD